jgi:hypothetical protein
MRSKAWTVFVRSNSGIVGSNPTRGMDVCVRLFLPTVYRIKIWKSGQGPKGCRAIEREREKKQYSKKNYAPHYVILIFSHYNYFLCRRYKYSPLQPILKQPLNDKNWVNERASNLPIKFKHIFLLRTSLVKYFDESGMK